MMFADKYGVSALYEDKEPNIIYFEKLIKKET